MRYQMSDNSIAELGEFSRLNYEQLESITQAEFHATYRSINSTSSFSMYYMYLHGDIALVAVLLAFTLLVSIMVFITLLVYPDEMLALARARKRRPVSMVIMQHPPAQIRHTTSTEDVSTASSVAAAAALARSYRRSSLAATLHANFISLGGHPDAFDAARRRLSNVSDVVSRKISRTIGWRSLSVSVELTVSQGKALCGQYIRSRLRRSGIFQRKLGLKRVRSAKLISGSSVVDEVFPVLDALGTELEKMHPQLYERVGRQIGRGLFNSEQKVSDALTDISRELLRAGECNWLKIASIYAVAGGIAVDCVKQGKPEFLPVIQRAMIIVLEEYLASWIQANGGWTALVLKYRPAPRQTNWQAGAVIFFGLVAVIWAIVCFAVAFKAFLL